MKKKSISILGIVVAVLLLIVVCVTLTLNVLFSQHDTPKIFGNYVYLMETDSMEVKPDRWYPDPATTVDASASFMRKRLLSVRHMTAVNRFPRTMRCFVYWLRRIPLPTRTVKAWQSVGF